MNGPKRQRRNHRKAGLTLLNCIPSRVVPLLLVVLLASPTPVLAYIGPGAGFALLSSFFVMGATLLFAVVSLLTWPLRLVRARLRRWRQGPALIKRLIIVGFDGQEPTLTDRWLAAGQLPNFAALAESGAYHRLRTTFPPVSPVAWSSFSTGTNPGRHNIFDFIAPDRRSYLPLLSSIRITPSRRALTLGRWRLPLGMPTFSRLRRSPPFWSLLGRASIWSTVLRVPITFPPDRFFGAQLSAMATPDLLGTQGTFLLYTTRPDQAPGLQSGVHVDLRFVGDRAESQLHGPPNPFASDAAPLSVAFSVTRDEAGHSVTIALPTDRVRLTVGAISSWVAVAFQAAPLVTVRGRCRLQLTEFGEHISIYVTPLNLDPEQPAMPISHPPYYATYLASKIGPYATLGLAEDTGALNEGVIDDETFLRQTWDIDDERQRMFFAALERLREGTLSCVFDATDRVQHMFWRDLDVTHPAARGRAARLPNAIEEQYQRNDRFLGQVMSRLGDGDLLMVLSDHGFSSFRRAVNINGWLLQQGFLTLKTDSDGTGDWLRDVDWAQTRAFAFGLTGIFLNQEGRERHGIVRPGAEAGELKAALVAALSGLRDEADGEVAIREVFDTSVVYNGPYQDGAPDLLVGYNAGYRVSWECASGRIDGPLFCDNVRPWSGDHCIDPRLVPGIFFCSRPIGRTEPSLLDIAPTALRLFGIEVPAHMEGTPLFEPAT